MVKVVGNYCDKLTLKSEKTLRLYCIMSNVTFAVVNNKHLILIVSFGCLYPFHSALSGGLKMTTDCLNYRVEKFTSYNRQNSIYLVPSTIKTDNRGIQSDACVGKFRFEVRLPCRTKEGVYFKQENGSWALTPAPWKSGGGAAAEKACDKYYF